ncbi:hypothetical protein ACIP97_24285 [Peribacillus frigoritolerans]|uniref:hypothetical protein n=1 Tax=Peribacillus frigoritolerans TaxID=450367 RepID=UPI00381684F3
MSHITEEKQLHFRADLEDTDKLEAKAKRLGLKLYPYLKMRLKEIANEDDNKAVQ